MHMALIILNLIFLIVSMAFNAKLLSLGGSDITLAYFNKIAEIGQLLSSFGFTLIVWKVLSFRRQGKQLLKAWGLAFLVAYPTAYVAQEMVSSYIANNLSHPYKVAALYAYVAKKDYSSRLIEDENNAPSEKKATGAQRAFLVNLGILLNPDSAYIKEIDSNFSGYAAGVFERYINRHADEFYERYQRGAVDSVKDIAKKYADDEVTRKNGFTLAQPSKVLFAPIITGGFEGENRGYSYSLPRGMTTIIQLERQKNIHIMAQERLGPLYVTGMNLLAGKAQFMAYVPSIASNMASEITTTDLNGSQGQMVIKNMIFLPIALFTSLFFGIISLVTLIFELIKARSTQPGESRLKLKVFIISVFLLAPIIVGNEIINSEPYIQAVANSGHDLNMLSPILTWSMVMQGWLYDIIAFI
jgi:hypothetical protein